MKTLLIVFLFVSFVAKAQNPFITRADIIAQFDISPNKQLLFCKWWGADKMLKFRVMDLGTKRVLNIDSISGKKVAALYFSDGVSFLSDNLVLVAKDKTILSYDIKKKQYDKLFNLSYWGESPSSLTATKDRKGVYLLDGTRIYYADLQTGIRDSVCLNSRAFVMDISTTVNNQVIYGVEEKDERGKNMHQVWSWDGRSQPINLTEQFSKVIKVPYLVAATSNPDLYIVASSDGMYRFDKHTQRAKKLIDNQDENPIIRIQVSDDNKTIYYLTAYQRVVVQTMDMDGKRGASITF